MLRKHKRTENNILLLLGDKNCMHNYNFVNNFTACPWNCISCINIWHVFDLICVDPVQLEAQGN